MMVETYLWLLMFVVMVVSGFLGYQLTRRPIGILLFQIFAFLIILIFLLSIVEFFSAL